MDHFVKLRKLSSSLTAEEFNEFLSTSSIEGFIKILQIMNKEQVMKVIFDLLVTAFQNADNLDQINDVIVPNVSDMNMCISSIIRSRKEEKRTAEVESSTLTLESLPNESISQISTYLSTQQTMKFERCSRTLLIAVRSAPLLNEVRLYRLVEDTECDFLSKTSNGVFRWHRLYRARSICFSGYHLPILQLPLFHELFPNLQSVTIPMCSASLKSADDIQKRFDTEIKLQSYESILEDAEKLAVSERVLSVIGYKYFKSLKSLKVNNWDLHNGPFFKLNGDWLEYLTTSNSAKLSKIEIIRKTDWNRQVQFGGEYVFKPITAIYNQCVANPKWTQNVLKSVKMDFFAIGLLVEG